MKSRLLPIFDEIFSSLSQKDPLHKNIYDFLLDYEKLLLTQKLDFNFYMPLVQNYLTQVQKNIASPYKFPLFHKSIRSELDYFKMGNDFFSPLIDKKNSTILGKSNIIQIDQALSRGENVILLANHQIEADPQIISIMTAPLSKRISCETIFVAGAKVVKDPLSIPFSMGMNLFCIYSKKYYEMNPTQKSFMQEHNSKTILCMRSELNQGGKCIYVAASGGRDREDENGLVIPEMFDEKSVDLFCLLAKKSKYTTHIYPLSLKTYDLMPPPRKRECAIGENRSAIFAPVHLHFYQKIDPHLIQEFAKTKEDREKRCRMIYDIVKKDHI